MSIVASLILIGLLLLLVGVAYSWWTANRPPKLGLTWLWVAIGCAFTNIALSLAIWVLTQNVYATLSPWAAYGLSGLPMILGQIFKDSDQKAEADGYSDRLGRSND